MTDFMTDFEFERFIKKLQESEEEIEYSEHPDNIEIRKKHPAPDGDFLKRRAKALNMVLNTPELCELISDIVDVMYENERNQLWWISQYLKIERMWYDDDATIVDIAEKIYDEAIVEQAETFDTAFQHMLRNITSEFRSFTLSNVNLSQCKSPDDIYRFVTFGTPNPLEFFKEDL